MGDGSRRGRRPQAWWSLLLAVCVALPAGGAAAPEVPATRPEDRVIFEAAAARRWSDLMEAKGEVWTPTLGDVTALEEKLPSYLRERYKNRRKEPLWKRAPRYKRQYLGLTRHGERVIYANFFCQVPSSRAQDWQTVPVIVDDGGDCYFSVEYDSKRGTFHDLLVNGEA